MPTFPFTQSITTALTTSITETTGGGGTPAPFTPLDISGLKVWLDGQDPNGNGTAVTDAATCSSWKDKSGNANHAEGASNQPVYDADGINSKQCISFDAASSRLTIPDNATLDKTRLSLYIVAQRTTDTGSGQVVLTKYGAGTITREIQVLVESATDKWQVLGSSTGSGTDINCTINQVATTGTPFLLDYHFNAAGANVFGANNTTFASDTETALVNSDNPITLGATSAGASSFRGRIGEILWFNRALTATEHAK